MTDDDVQQLLDSASAAHRDWWSRDDDEEDLAALVQLHDLSRQTLKSPELDLDAADKVVEAGIGLLTADDPVDRIFGIRLIREMHRKDEVAQELLAALRRETDEDVISWCVGGLYFRGTADALPDLAGMVNHHDSDLRYRLAGAISTCAVPTMSPSALNALLELADDEDADVRFSALFELSSWWQDEDLQFRDARVEARLQSGLSDPDEGVRRTCGEAFGEDE